MGILLVRRRDDGPAWWGESMGKRSLAERTALHESMLRRLYRGSVARGQITLAAVPAMLDDYVNMCDSIFASMGRRFTPEQLSQVRSVLESQLTEAYSASQRSQITIAWEAPVGTVLNYHVRPEWLTIEGAYDNWVATREPPLFGKEPDARVWALAGEAGDPSTLPVLDIGAGTGRNALALARRGHPVDAIEATPKFADIIRIEAAKEFLTVRVLQRDMFATLGDLRQDYQLIVLSEVVSDFRSEQQLRGVFELASHALAPGGRLVFNAFLVRDDHALGDDARQLGQQLYTSIFTRDEMARAAVGFPLSLVTDDSVYDYEKAHLPEGAWPQTSWYEGWISGLDVFDLDRANSPIELRWLVYQKAD
jgi:SAM-dependent methyltransferase